MRAVGQEVGPVHVECCDAPQRFLRVQPHRTVGWLARRLAAGAGHSFHIGEGVRFYEIRHEGHDETIPLFQTLANAGISDDARLQIKVVGSPPRLVERMSRSAWATTDLMRSGLPPGHLPEGLQEPARARYAVNLLHGLGNLPSLVAIACTRWPDDDALRELLAQLTWYGSHVANVAPTAWYCLQPDERQRLCNLWANCSALCG